MEGTVADIKFGEAAVGDATCATVAFEVGICGCGVVAGAGDGVVGGAIRGDSGSCSESSSMDPDPCAWL